MPPSTSSHCVPQSAAHARYGRPVMSPFRPQAQDCLCMQRGRGSAKSPRGSRKAPRRLVPPAPSECYRAPTCRRQHELILSAERALTHSLSMPVLQPREIGFGEDGQESWHRRAVLQGLRATIPDGDKLQVVHLLTTGHYERAPSLSFPKLTTD